MATLSSRLDALDQDLNRLLEGIREYSDDHLNRSPGEGKWSALQVMQHLMLAEKMSLQSVQYNLGRTPRELSATGLISGFRSAALGLFLDLPFSIKAPDVVADAQFPSTSTFWAVAREYRQVRIALRQLLAEIPDDYHNKQLFRHPLAGGMGPAGMLHFFDRHFVRHKKQIYKALGR